MVITKRASDAYDAAHATPVGPNQPYRKTLQWLLAHELDHLNGNGHILQNGYENVHLTPNTAGCSDVYSQFE